MVCKTIQVGVTPARDSISSGISVERHTPVLQTGIVGALPTCPAISRGAKSRCRSGLHRSGCGGSTPPSCPDWVANFDSEVPPLNRQELGASPRQPTISASVVKLLSSSASNGEFAGESPAGCASLCRVSPTTRDTPLRTERLGVEIPHAAPFGMSTGLANRASVLTSACLRASGASPRHSAMRA